MFAETLIKCIMKAVKIKDIKKGEYFTFKPIEFPTDSQVWIREDYERSSKRYSCTKFSDICHEKLVKGDKIVYVGFSF